MLAGESHEGDIRTLGATYPALNGATVTGEGGSGTTAAGVEVVHYYMQFGPGVRPLTRYRGDEIILPAAPGENREFHPVMVWWAILFTMSMLTRYRPKIWTDIVNVDTSAYAVPTEFVLDAALDSVPDLLAYALDDAPTT